MIITWSYKPCPGILKFLLASTVLLWMLSVTLDSSKVALIVSNLNIVPKTIFKLYNLPEFLTSEIKYNGNRNRVPLHIFVYRNHFKHHALEHGENLYWILYWILWIINYELLKVVCCISVYHFFVYNLNAMPGESPDTSTYNPQNIEILYIHEAITKPLLKFILNKLSQN